jgi:cytidylate kinase
MGDRIHTCDDAAVSELLIITGPPGSGKSTVASLVADRFVPSALVQGDMFFGFVSRGYIDPWLSESHEQNTVVTKATARATSVYARGGFTTVFDGMVGPWFLPTFLEHAEVESVNYAVLLPGVETCVARVLARTDHGFREEAVTRQMHASFADGRVEPRSVIDAEPDPIGWPTKCCAASPQGSWPIRRPRPDRVDPPGHPA